MSHVALQPPPLYSTVSSCGVASLAATAFPLTSACKSAGQQPIAYSRIYPLQSLQRDPDSGRSCSLSHGNEPRILAGGLHPQLSFSPVLERENFGEPRFAWRPYQGAENCLHFSRRSPEYYCLPALVHGLILAVYTRLRFGGEIYVTNYFPDSYISINSKYAEGPLAHYIPYIQALSVLPLPCGYSGLPL